MLQVAFPHSTGFKRVHAAGGTCAHLLLDFHEPVALPLCIGAVVCRHPAVRSASKLRTSTMQDDFTQDAWNTFHFLRLLLVVCESGPWKHSGGWGGARSGVVDDGDEQAGNSEGGAAAEQAQMQRPRHREAEPRHYLQPAPDIEHSR